MTARPNPAGSAPPVSIAAAKPAPLVPRNRRLDIDPLIDVALSALSKRETTLL
jgi:hypothetical protein